MHILIHTSTTIVYYMIIMLEYHDRVHFGTGSPGAMSEQKQPQAPAGKLGDTYAIVPSRVAALPASIAAHSPRKSLPVRARAALHCGFMACARATHTRLR